MTPVTQCTRVSVVRLCPFPGHKPFLTQIMLLADVHPSDAPYGNAGDELAETIRVVKQGLLMGQLPDDAYISLSVRADDGTLCDSHDSGVTLIWPYARSGEPGQAQYDFLPRSIYIWTGEVGNVDCNMPRKTVLYGPTDIPKVIQSALATVHRITFNSCMYGTLSRLQCKNYE